MPTIAELLEQAAQAHESGNLALVELYCQQILQTDATHPDALHRLGLLAAQSGDALKAIQYLRRSLERQPQQPACHFNLAMLYQQLGKLDDAAAAFREVLRYQPNFPLALANLGRILAEQGKLEEAAVSYKKAVRLQPDFVLALQELGIIQYQLRQYDAAIASYRAALRLNPQDGLVHYNLGIACATEARLPEALTSFREAVRLRPDLAFAHSNLVMHLNYDPEIDSETLFAEHRRWAELHASPQASFQPHSNDRDPARKLRIGYVSPDFRAHPVPYFMGPVLTHHDPNQVEVICYAEVARPDAVTGWLQKLAHGWRSSVGMTDAQLAEQVRRDRIDILVDLAGHSPYTRLTAFKHRPAPIQVSYLSYPHSTGLAMMDYRLTDAVADPPGCPSLSTEELIRLPDSFACYQPLGAVADPGPLPADQAGHIAFGSLHRLLKLNARVLDVWSAILRALPDARLLIYRDELTAGIRDALLRSFAERGVESRQLDLRGALPSGADHWSLYREIDIALDAFPWSGHTTVCESLWAGVPMVTLRGNRFAGRMVASVLTCLGMTDWIAETPEQYVELAVAKAKDLEALRRLRASLRPRMQASPLCDGERFTRGLEAAFRSMWRKWCES